MTEAERVHEALRATTERLCGLYDVARYERRRGYDLLVFPPIPVAQFNAVWPLEDASAEALEVALEEIAELGLPSSVQVRSGVTPAAADEAKRLGLTNAEPLPGLAVQPDERNAGGASRPRLRGRSHSGRGARGLRERSRPRVAAVERDGLSVYRRLGFREVERYVLLTRPEAA
jgi:hypothetical protein